MSRLPGVVLPLRRGERVHRLHFDVARFRAAPPVSSSKCWDLCYERMGARLQRPMHEKLPSRSASIRHAVGEVALADILWRPRKRHFVREGGYGGRTVEPSTVGVRPG
jgi:hypothetical protein